MQGQHHYSEEKNECSPEVPPMADMVPTGWRSNSFGTAAPMGAGHLSMQTRVTLTNFPALT